MSTPLGGGHIIFAFSCVQHLLSIMLGFISRKSIYPMFTKFGMGVYWVNSLHGIAFVVTKIYMKDNWVNSLATIAFGR